ncbi:hypothetical protein ECWI2_3093 [Escherichia coli]|nr:hypothetical protein ECWI2_3093 [Escherichia coli]
MMSDQAKTIGIAEAHHLVLTGVKHALLVHVEHMQNCST